MKRDKIIFYVFTGIFTFFIGAGASRYYWDHEWALGEFSKLGFPDWLPYTLGALKFLGLIAIWFIKSDTLKQWAYAGFTFNLLLAMGAHLAVGDGEFMGAVITLVLLAGSYIFYGRVSKAS